MTELLLGDRVAWRDGSLGTVVESNSRETHVGWDNEVNGQTGGCYSTHLLTKIGEQ